MKKLILLRGPLGVGKTTIAQKLAAALNARVVSIDSVLEENGLDHAEDEGIPLKISSKETKSSFPKSNLLFWKANPLLSTVAFIIKNKSNILF